MRKVFVTGCYDILHGSIAEEGNIARAAALYLFAEPEYRSTAIAGAESLREIEPFSRV